MSPSYELTPKRRQVLDFITSTTQERGYPPTVREIGAAVGLKSSSSVHYHLRALEHEGFITRDKGAGKTALTRAIRVADDQADSRRAQTRYLPLAVAGRPILATENIGVHTDSRSFGSGDLFLPRSAATRMTGRYSRRRSRGGQPASTTGRRIVVALLGDEATIKYLYRHADGIELRPANAALEPIFVDDVQIIGRVRGVIRSLR